MTVDLVGVVHNEHVKRVLLTAAYAGVRLRLVNLQEAKDNVTAAYRRNCDPLGRIPVLKTDEGYICEPTAMVRYLARIQVHHYYDFHHQQQQMQKITDNSHIVGNTSNSNNSNTINSCGSTARLTADETLRFPHPQHRVPYNLYGNSLKEAAQIDAWLDFVLLRLDANAMPLLTMMHREQQQQSGAHRLHTLAHASAEPKSDRTLHRNSATRRHSTPDTYSSTYLMPDAVSPLTGATAAETHSITQSNTTNTITHDTLCLCNVDQAKQALWQHLPVLEDELRALHDIVLANTGAVDSRSRAGSLGRASSVERSSLSPSRLGADEEQRQLLMHNGSQLITVHTRGPRVQPAQLMAVYNVAESIRAKLDEEEQQLQEQTIQHEQQQQPRMSDRGGLLPHGEDSVAAALGSTRASSRGRVRSESARRSVTGGTAHYGGALAGSTNALLPSSMSLRATVLLDAAEESLRAASVRRSTLLSTTPRRSAAPLTMQSEQHTESDNNYHINNTNNATTTNNSSKNKSSAARCSAAPRRTRSQSPSVSEVARDFSSSPHRLDRANRLHDELTAHTSATKDAGQGSDLVFLVGASLTMADLQVTMGLHTVYSVRRLLLPARRDFPLCYAYYHSILKLPLAMEVFRQLHLSPITG